MPNDSSTSTGDNASHQKKLSRSVGIWLGSIATIIGIATGVFTLRDQIFPPDETPSASTPSIPYFDGVVGHLERSERFIGFLQQHDGDPVRMQAGFQLSLDDFGAKGFGQAGSQSEQNAYIVLYTTCNPPLSTAERERVRLGFTREVMGYGRCMGDELHVGPDTDESGIYVSHGTPRLEGYFRVNVGDMHQGLVGIQLTPITASQATGT